jgi:hypothetical protein
MGRRQVRRSLSRILDTIGSRLIGGYEVRAWGGFPGLRRRMMCATFNWEGKWLRSRIALKRWVRNLMPTGGSSLRILLVIRYQNYE